MSQYVNLNENNTERNNKLYIMSYIIDYETTIKVSKNHVILICY